MLVRVATSSHLKDNIVSLRARAGINGRYSPQALNVIFIMCTFTGKR